ncbi:hypothetical protein BSL78_22520 [Apostichopus japonicus]|uniref:Uncharacterized protein n=1 Tax=Stichopus japonicus TaxID=307972 RepID=A0A2G8JY01_STIJA|nr:hypothetical protein BSL78_22520 [Apostichopus japonicus]
MIEPSDVQFSTWTSDQTPINGQEPNDRTFCGSPRFLTRGDGETVRVFAGGVYQKSITMGGIRPITVTLEQKSLYGQGEWSSVGRVTLDSEQLGFTVQIQTRDRMAGRHMLRYVARNSQTGSQFMSRL